MWEEISFFVKIIINALISVNDVITATENSTYIPPVVGENDMTYKWSKILNCKLKRLKKMSLKRHDLVGENVMYPLPPSDFGQFRLLVITSSFRELIIAAHFF